MAVSKLNTTANGAQCVTIIGIKVIQMFCAVSSGSLVLYRLLAVQHTVKVWILSGLMMSTVRGQRPLCLIVLIWNGENTTVPIRKMLVLCVTLG